MASSLKPLSRPVPTQAVLPSGLRNLVPVEYEVHSSIFSASVRFNLILVFQPSPMPKKFDIGHSRSLSVVFSVLNPCQYASTRYPLQQPRCWMLHMSEAHH